MNTGTINTHLELPVSVEYEAGEDIKIISFTVKASELTELQRHTLVNEIEAELEKERQESLDGGLGSAANWD